MNYKMPPFIRQCYCPFSFSLFKKEKGEQKRMKKTVQNITDWSLGFVGLVIVYILCALYTLN